MKKDNRKLRDKLNNKSQSSSMNNNSTDKLDNYLNYKGVDLKPKSETEKKNRYDNIKEATSVNSSTDLFLNYSDLVVNKSQDDLSNFANTDSGTKSPNLNIINNV